MSPADRPVSPGSALSSQPGHRSHALLPGSLLTGHQQQGGQPGATQASCLGVPLRVWACHCRGPKAPGCPSGADTPLPSSPGGPRHLCSLRVQVQVGPGCSCPEAPGAAPGDRQRSPLRCPTSASGAHQPQGCQLSCRSVSDEAGVGTEVPRAKSTWARGSLPARAWPGAWGPGSSHTAARGPLRPQRLQDPHDQPAKDAGHASS